MFVFLKRRLYIIEDLHTSFDEYYNSEKTPNTMDILTQLDSGIYFFQSPYINQDDFDRLKKQITGHH